MEITAASLLLAAAIAAAGVGTVFAREAVDEPLRFRRDGSYDGIRLRPFGILRVGKQHTPCCVCFLIGAAARGNNKKRWITNPLSLETKGLRRGQDLCAA